MMKKQFICAQKSTIKDQSAFVNITKRLWEYFNFRMSSFVKDVQSLHAHKSERGPTPFQSLVGTTGESCKLFSPTL